MFHNFHNTVYCEIIILAATNPSLTRAKQRASPAAAPSAYLGWIEVLARLRWLPLRFWRIRPRIPALNPEGRRTLRSLSSLGDRMTDLGTFEFELPRVLDSRTDLGCGAAYTREPSQNYLGRWIWSGNGVQVLRTCDSRQEAGSALARRRLWGDAWVEPADGWSLVG